MIDVPASLVNTRTRIEYQVQIKRKTLFYTVVLIIPTVLLAFLSMTVFFLPADSTEKVTLTISVLLSIVVFLLLVSKILPPTSSTIPLMAKYLLLIFVLNVISILLTVIVLNLYHRGPNTHQMAYWVHFVFLKIMPKLLCMQRPKVATQKIPKTSRVRGGLTTLPGVGEFSISSTMHYHHPHCPSAEAPTSSNPHPGFISHEDQIENLDPTTSAFYPLTPEAIRAIEAIEYITNHLKKDEEIKMKKHDWKYVSMVVDRFLLYVFFGVTLGGTIGILLSAPDIFNTVDQEKELERLKALYKLNKN